MTAELRSFVFPMQPLMQRSQWRLDRARRSLGKLSARICGTGITRSIAPDMARSEAQGSSAKGCGVGCDGLDARA